MTLIYIHDIYPYAHPGSDWSDRTNKLHWLLVHMNYTWFDKCNETGAKKRLLLPLLYKRFAAIKKI